MKTTNFFSAKGVAVLCLAMLSLPLQAKITLPSVFMDNMVLQQKRTVPIYGTSSKPGETISLKASWNNKVLRSQVAADGQWSIALETPSFGGPYSIELSDGEALTLNNVLIGDVWFCSGQSNMEMPLAGWGKVQNYEEEIRTADYPNIRFLQVKQETNNRPQEQATLLWGGWQAVSPTSIPEFSATAYFFAREVYKQTGVPIGLIHASWGGTIIEAWMSKEALKPFPAYSKTIDRMLSKTAAADFERELAQWKQTVIDKDKGQARDGLGWLAANVNTTDWKTMTLPAHFDKDVFPNLNGIVYFRKVVKLPVGWKGKELKLSLGPIDDNDVTYVNGVKVGETMGYTTDRNYVIPNAQTNADELHIAIQVFDGAGEGGIYGNADQLKLIAPNGEEYSLAGDWLCQVGVDFKDLDKMPQGNEGANRPTVLYNAMVQPFVDFKIAGFLWYQGEANTDNPNLYRQLLPSLISDWRMKWQDQKLPFYLVQLANFKPTDTPIADDNWPKLRDAQLAATAIPGVEMAVIADIGEAHDIHPKNKQDVGKRLAWIALHNYYKKEVAFSGPKLLKSTINNGQITLLFKPMAKELVAKDLTSTANLTGFSIAGADQVYYPAKAKLVRNTVILSSEHVVKPVSARYGWADNPILSLYNDAGLPASPFSVGEK